MDSPEDIALADRMNAGRKRIEAELAKLIVGQQDVINQVLLTLFVGGNSLIVGVPGLAKTLLDPHAGAGARPEVQPHPVHAGPDAVRHHRHRHHPGRSGDRRAPDDVRARADLREHRPRRRNQPHAAEDAGGAARGDAGAPRHDPGPDLHPRRAVLRLRHAEPDRARRHLPAAGSAARPLHVPHRHRASARGRGVRRRADDDGDARSEVRAAGDGRRSRRVPDARAPRAGGRAGDALRAAPRADEPAEGARTRPSWSRSTWRSARASARRST